MADSVRVQFFRVAKCGYFEWRQEEPEFGDLAEIMRQLHRWVHREDVHLKDTCTFNVLPGSEEFGTYCVDCLAHKPTGDYVFLIWNEMENQEGRRIASMSGDALVGAGKVKVMKVAEGDIPGRATYFWVLPKEGLIASISPDVRITGIGRFQNYVKHFMDGQSDFARLEDGDDDDDAIVVGYAEDPGDEPQDLRPHFKLGTVRRASVEATIRRKRENIVRIVRKMELTPKRPKHRGLFKSMFEVLDLSDAPALPRAVKARYQIDYTPTEEQLETMIQSTGEIEKPYVDDVGFTMKEAGDTKTLWLHRVLARRDVQLALRWDRNGSMVDGKSLLAEIQDRRRSLLRMVAEEDDE